MRRIRFKNGIVADLNDDGKWECDNEFTSVMLSSVTDSIIAGPSDGDPLRYRFMSAVEAFRPQIRKYDLTSPIEYDERVTY